MSGFGSLWFTLALVFSMQAIKTPSTSVIVNASVTSQNAASTSAAFMSSQDAITTAVASTGVVVQSSQAARSNVESSSQYSTIASTASIASAAVNSSQNISTVSVASTTVVVMAGNITTSNVASTSVAVQYSPNMTIAGVAATSVGYNLTSSSTGAVQNYSLLTSSLTYSLSSLYSSADTNSSLTGSSSPHPTPGISSSVHFNETSPSSTQVSPNASSFTSTTNTTKSLSSAAVATSFTSQPVSTFLAPGQTSKTSRLPSSVVLLPPLSDSQFTQVGTSTLAQSFSKATVSVMTHLVASLTVSITKSSSTASAPINTTSAVPPATPTTSQTIAPTLPPEGTKFVSMEVSFAISFKKEYRDTSSSEYQELIVNLTTTMEKIYRNVDGFVGVHILFITEGSVVCRYIVILAKDSNVKKSELEEKLQQASDAGQVFKVKSIKFADDDSEKTEEKLPNWALVVMIVLGCLSAIFLVTAIYVCVKYRRSLYGNSDAYLVSTGEIGLVHTYDTVSIGDNKTAPANKGTSQKPAAERRVIGSHTNPTYGSNGALADEAK